MAKVEEKLTWKQVLDLHWWAAKIWWEIEPKLFLSTGLTALFKTLTPYVTIWLSARIIDELSGGRDPKRLMLLVIVTVGATALLSAVASVLNRWKEAVHGLENRYEDRILNEKMMDMDYAASQSAATKDVTMEMRYHMMGNCYGFVKVHSWYLEYIVRGLADVAGALALCASMFLRKVPESGGSLQMLNHPLAVLAFILLLAGTVALPPVLTMKQNRYYEVLWPTMNRNNRYFNGFGALGYRRERMLDIRLYNQQEMAKEERRKLEPGIESQVRTYRGPMGLYAAAAAMGGGLLMGLTYSFVCLKALGGAFGIGSVTQYVGAITAMCGGVREMVGILADWRRNAGFLDAIRHYLEIPNDMYQGSLTTEKRSDRKYDVEFRDVSFKYPGRDNWALRHVNMKFQVGSRLAIVGENGSGKTTFIKLLCRLYDATEGEIRLNGIDIRKYNLRQYMDVFSVVFQDFHLLAQPLGANVASSRNYDRELVTDCLQKAGFGERLAAMPKGLDTWLYKNLSKDGVEISGGEAQKIAIARALYKDAPFIILDEPTAALDPIAEAEIYSKFSDIVTDKTAIYISHRLSSCRFCDEIAVFDHGQIVQTGSHDDLVAREGKYADLWNAQAQYYTES